MDGHNSNSWGRVFFVMSGELAFAQGAKVHMLKIGESIHFNSEVLHKLKNLSSEVTRCLVVLYTI
jgi:uncharacterized cupin superfamily protein